MGEFQHGLCGCFNDCSLCVITYFLPCYVEGKNSEAVAESCFLCGCLQLIPIVNCISRMKVRTKIREAKGIEGSAGKDCCLHLFCGFCAIIQEAQEVKGMPALPSNMARE